MRLLGGWVKRIERNNRIGVYCSLSLTVRCSLSCSLSHKYKASPGEEISCWNGSDWEQWWLHALSFYSSTPSLFVCWLIYVNVTYIYEKCLNFRCIYMGFTDKTTIYLRSNTVFLPFINELNASAFVFVLLLVLFAFACFNTLRMESFSCIRMSNGKNNQVRFSFKFISSSVSLNK